MMSEDEELVRLMVRSKDGTREHDVRIVQINPNGQLAEPVVQFMVKYFIPRETMNTILGFASDTKSIESITEFWREKISDGNSIAALLADSNEIVAANITYVLGKDEEEFEDFGEGDTFVIIGQVLKQLMDGIDVCEEYGVDKYLNAVGLTVHPQYHGLGLGLEVLKAREPLCKKLGLTCSATIFTSSISQGLATKAGFKQIHSRRYRDFFIDDKRPFEIADDDKCLKVMARSYSH